MKMIRDLNDYHVITYYVSKRIQLFLNSKLALRWFFVFSHIRVHCKICLLKSVPFGQKDLSVVSPKMNDVF